MHRLLSIAFLALPLWCSAADANIPSYKELAALDFPALKAALEKAGWPAEHVQTFVGLEIQRRLNPPDTAKASDFSTFEFWRTGPDAEPLSVINTPEHLAERARQAQEARTQFSTLFPPSDTEEEKLLRAWNEQRQWGNLPMIKREAAITLLTRAEQERDTFANKNGGTLSDVEQRQLWKLVEDTRAELAHLLTPEELLDYDLRNSATATRMRSELDNFQPTQAEFLALFKLRHPLELNFGHKNIGADPEIDRQRTESEEQVQKSISQHLGRERYDDYCISLQPACQNLQFDGHHACTDAATIRRLFRSLLLAQTRIQKLNSLPEAEKKPAQTKIKNELHEEFRLVLGEDAAGRYLEEQGLWP